MPPLPPLKFVLEALHDSVLPAAGGAALVVCAFLVLGRCGAAAAVCVTRSVVARVRGGSQLPAAQAVNPVPAPDRGNWPAALGSAVAVVVGFLAANFTLANVKFDEQPTWENTHRLIPWRAADTPEAPPPGWHRLPRSALALLAVGLLSRWAGLLAGRVLPERWWWAANVLVWVPRVAAVAVVSGWLVSGKAASAPEWEGLRYQLGAVMLLAWVALDSFARSEPVAGAEAAGYQTLMFFTAGAVLLYAHNAKFMEAAVVLGSALFGVAAAARVGRADASGAIPATVVFLPGLILGTRPSHPEHAVPAAAFWLVALAPAVLLPFLVPALGRKTGPVVRVIRLVLVFAPLVAAGVLAAQHEKLAFEEDY